ncbi:uncharacterized protein LOC132169941 [Corylus avellana]|uniref:uncharacterized protein LOC132169941 n=1 Tax=Corylus avellana TaxID=13451 RepID=UPI00286C9998|nr:uncharacterized protein LOC132169941 [Corylus avellana]
MPGSVAKAILGGLKRIWHSWNLRGCILLSLFLQASLLILAPFRKRSRKKLVHGGVWVAYLLCDWIAAVAIGLITKSKGDAREQKMELKMQGKMKEGSEAFMAFWASFLLLHLGGPDTITSFAVEDNQFWFRHLTGLVVQLVSTSYIFYQTFPTFHDLWLPTVMVFVAGTIKYAERTRSLYLASSGHFGSSVLRGADPGPDYEEAVTIYSSLNLIQVPTHAEVIPTLEIAPPNKDSNSTGTTDHQKEQSSLLEADIKLLQEAHRLFESFKGLIVGYLLSSKDRELSRQYFLTRNANEAFRLIAYELNFMYDLLHTKVVVARTQIGYFFRFISFSTILVAFMLFRSIEKQYYGDDKYFDVNLSYALLGGALGFEAVTLLMLIFSDWTLIANNFGWTRFIAKIILKRQRWSRSISRYDMISYCLKVPPPWFSRFATKVRLGGVLDKINIFLFSRHPYAVSEDLEDFIFNQLRMKSLTANNLKAAMEACSQRGDWALMQTSGCFKLKWSIEEYQYAESLLLWHLATELLYHTDLSCSQEKEKPELMAPVLGNWQIAFKDTCEEAKRFFNQKGIKRSQQLEACKKVLMVNTSKFRPVAVKGSKSKSIFFDACILAKQLRNLEVDQWMLMSRVWVELMSYAAIKCIPLVHAQQPSKGGELLTFVWLLMNHLGLGTQFYEHEREIRTKMADLSQGQEGGHTEGNSQNQEKEEKQESGCTSRLIKFSKLKYCCK